MVCINKQWCIKGGGMIRKIGRLINYNSSLFTRASKWFLADECFGILSYDDWWSWWRRWRRRLVTADRRGRRLVSRLTAVPVRRRCRQRKNSRKTTTRSTTGGPLAAAAMVRSAAVRTSLSVRPCADPIVAAARPSTVPPAVPAPVRCTVCTRPCTRQPAASPSASGIVPSSPGCPPFPACSPETGPVRPMNNIKTVKHTSRSR